MSTPPAAPTDAPSGGGSDLSSVVKLTLDAIAKMMKLYRVERVVHLGLSAFAIVLLLYGVARLLVAEEITRDLLVALFGPSGLLAASSMRLTYFFNRAFRLLEMVMRAYLPKAGDQ